MRMNNEPFAVQKLNEAFGGLRAEYFRKEIYDLFATPSYWPELLTRRPCLLVGGRGTGKTTALRGLSYEGLHHLEDRKMAEWSHVGFYWRIDTNTVRAFRGASLSEKQWTRYFAHYLNIVLVQQIVEFLLWVEEIGEEPIELGVEDLARCCRSLQVEPVGNDLKRLASNVENALIEFESKINNISGSEDPRLSILGRPLTYITRALSADSRLTEKPIFFLVDEYENFEDYQQRVFNTLIKHAGDEGYTFKIGMKATGHRERTTINPDEVLVEPADYALIDIADRLKGEDFATFAREVCTGRLKGIFDESKMAVSIEYLLPSVPEEEEARLLGAEVKKSALRSRLLIAGATPPDLEHFDSMSPLSAYMVEYWAGSQKSEELSVLRSSMNESAQWVNRLNNYQHAALYTIRRGKRGVSKYYCGWATYVLLADGNIRYLLQLVNEALQENLKDKQSLDSPVAPRIQTIAAQAVGGRLVAQLQGLSPQGADLTRLVLGLGRVFQVMAANPEGHAAEVSQFRIKSGRGEPFDSFTEEVLSAAVMHLAVRRFPGDKMAGKSGETRDFNYQLHPIFAPFFVFGHRSKRRMEISSKEIYEIVRTPSVAVRKLLEKSNRGVPDELPEQMTLFKEYFG